MTPRARILPAPAGEPATRLLEPRRLGPGIGEPQRRRIVREEADARVAAERIMNEAKATAEAIVGEARARAATALETATREAQEEASTQLAARWLALREREQGSLGRDGERAVALAVAMAERLLGASLALDPARIVELARGVLDEAGGARRAVIDAHPLDADELRARLSTASGNSPGDGGLALQSVEVRADAALARGELRLHTDLGTIDARLAPRFERLAAAVRDALGDPLV